MHNRVVIVVKVARSLSVSHSPEVCKFACTWYEAVRKYAAWLNCWDILLVENER